MLISVGVSSTKRVGATSPKVPSVDAFPSPESTCSRGARSSKKPNMYAARRVMVVPASTFSLTASTTKPSGAMTGTLGLGSGRTARAPPKWSMWLWV